MKMNLAMKISISILVLLSVIFIAQTWIISNYTNSSILKLQKNNLAKSVEQLTDLLDESLHNYQNITYLNGNTSEVISALEKGDQNSLIKLTQKFTSQNELFENVSITDASGKIVASSASALIGFDNSKLSMWDECFKNNEDHYIDPQPIMTEGNT